RLRGPRRRCPVPGRLGGTRPAGRPGLTPPAGCRRLTRPLGCRRLTRPLGCWRLTRPVSPRRLLARLTRARLARGQVVPPMAARAVAAGCTAVNRAAGPGRTRGPRASPARPEEPANAIDKPQPHMSHSQRSRARVPGYAETLRTSSLVTERNWLRNGVGYPATRLNPSRTEHGCG